MKNWSDIKFEDLEITLKAITPEDGGGWRAYVPKFGTLGLIGDGDTPEEALAMLKAELPGFLLQMETAKAPIPSESTVLLGYSVDDVSDMLSSGHDDFHLDHIYRTKFGAVERCKELLTGLLEGYRGSDPRIPSNIPGYELNTSGETVEFQKTGVSFRVEDENLDCPLVSAVISWSFRTIQVGSEEKTVLVDGETYTKRVPFRRVTSDWTPLIRTYRRGWLNTMVSEHLTTEIHLYVKPVKVTYAD